MIDVDRHSASAYARPSEGRRRPRLAAHEASPAEPANPRLFDRVRTALRSRHYSRRTEEAYVAWIRRYILFHGKRHPMEMGAPEITRFLSFLAVDGKVAASTQNQAGAERSAVPLSRGAGTRRSLAGRSRPGQTSGTPPSRPDARRGPRGDPTPRGRAAADGLPALRRRVTGARVLPAACAGRRLRDQPDRRPWRQGRQGPGDDAAGGGETGAGAASRERPRAASR